jgi:hypothetical protein
MACRLIEINGRAEPFATLTANFKMFKRRKVFMRTRFLIFLTCVALTGCSSEESGSPEQQAQAPESTEGATMAEAAPAAVEAPAASEAEAPAATEAEVAVPAEEPSAEQPAMASEQPAKSAKPTSESEDLSYEVECPEGATDAGQCQVDQATYVGWRTFQANCFVCHGAGGVGTTFGPNLQERLNASVDYERFLQVLENGYTGQVGAMPAWKGNPQVMPKAKDLYVYLKARADGLLPNGRPKRKKE